MGPKTWNTFVCLSFIFAAAGEDQRDHTKTFQTGNECPPCTCHAASSTCWSSCLLGKTCNDNNDKQNYIKSMIMVMIVVVVELAWVKLAICRTRSASVPMKDHHLRLQLLQHLWIIEKSGLGIIDTPSE